MLSVSKPTAHRLLEIGFRKKWEPTISVWGAPVYFLFAKLGKSHDLYYPSGNSTSAIRLCSLPEIVTLYFGKFSLRRLLFHYQLLTGSPTQASLTFYKKYTKILWKKCGPGDADPGLCSCDRKAESRTNTGFLRIFGPTCSLDAAGRKRERGEPWRNSGKGHWPQWST